jgi:NTP pyrophosphatase (non-canonical NTP hydrolase)
MSKDSLTELSIKLKDFAVRRDWEQFHSPKNLAMAISAEAGELLEHFQWLTEQQSQEIEGNKKQEVAYEMADILIYLLRLSEQLDIDLVSAAYEKMAINEKRYPADKVKGDSRRADDYE